MDTPQWTQLQLMFARAFEAVAAVSAGSASLFDPKAAATVTPSSSSSSTSTRRRHRHGRRHHRDSRKDAAPTTTTTTTTTTAKGHTRKETMPLPLETIPAPRRRLPPPLPAAAVGSAVVVVRSRAADNAAAIAHMESLLAL